MFDDEVVYGHKFHKTIQAMAWSHRKGLAGLNPLSNGWFGASSSVVGAGALVTLPIGLLTRHGASEWLRLLSEGRFLAISTLHAPLPNPFLEHNC